jgi:hypothetical protein
LWYNVVIGGIMCYSGLCKYENHMGKCRHSFKFVNKKTVYPEGSQCGSEHEQDLIEEAYELETECPKCSAVMEVESAWYGVTHNAGTVSVEYHCRNCGCMIEEGL